MNAKQYSEALVRKDARIAAMETTLNATNKLYESRREYIVALEADLKLSREQTEYANDAMMAMCERAQRAEDRLEKANKLLHTYHLKDKRNGTCRSCDYIIDSYLD